ncbi:MFS transporter [Amycolatopsis viridis]|uniref:MFS transporter n=1 Tax=Amycolatopsis viridis TaxID=185678 RepID=UPI0014202D6C|nr:MFS transporter [Amycolatopsis viridis]
MPPSSVAAVAPARGDTNANRWWILVVIGFAQLMVVLDSTIVNIALPSAQHDLAFSDDVRQWVGTAYALAFGSLLLLGGRVADLFGRRPAFLVGLAGFALMSALGGAANGIELLIVARAGQGVFGALLAPAALSLLSTTFTDPAERGKAFGVFGAIAGGGAAIGLLLGGALTQYLDWRWCMFVNIVFAAVAFAGAVAMLRPLPRTGGRPKLDVPGTLTASAGLFALVQGVAHAEAEPWSAVSVWGFLAVGVALLTLFVYLQTTVEYPLLPMRVLFDRDRGGSFLSVFLRGIGMFPVLLFLTYYLQRDLGFAPITSGVAFLPMVATLMAGAAAASGVLSKFGSRALISLGMLIAAAALCWLSAIDTVSTYFSGVLFPLMVFGLGIGVSTAPAMSAATTGVRAGDAGVASATVHTAQQIGGSIGTALVSTLVANAVTTFTGGTAPVPGLAAEAAVHGYRVAFSWSAGFFAFGTVVCAVLLRPRARDASGRNRPQ